ncbi:hypothetical protein BANRA_00001 [Acinetobacter baumannii]|nr:hypothetical protein BANRA_00001 [Acinetobacter baumannii]
MLIDQLRTQNSLLSERCQTRPKVQARGNDQLPAIPKNDLHST